MSCNTTTLGEKEITASDKKYINWGWEEDATKERRNYSIKEAVITIESLERFSEIYAKKASCS